MQDWIGPYQEEFNQVKNRRLEQITDKDKIDEIKHDALPLRMILETKRDGRRKGRLVAIGFKEPRHWDVKSNSSPVASINTIPYRRLSGNQDLLWEELSLGPVLAVGWVL